MAIAEDEPITILPDEPRPAGGPRAESLSESVAVLLALMIVQRLIGFVRSVLFCRWLSPEQLGQWDMAYGFLMFAAPLAVLGLPGSFGRYVEHYRQREQLRSFLRRACITSLGLGTAAMTCLVLVPSWFASLIFGSDAPPGMMPIITVGLAATIVFNLLTSLFIALRRSRVVSLMQFVSSLVFASLGTFLLWRAADPRGAIAAFTVSYLVAIAWAMFWMRSMWRSLPQCGDPLSYRSMWTRLMPFAFGLWVTNWLLNMFEIADRFLLVHTSGLDSATALDLVGQYHSARLVPVLMVSIAELLAAVMMPHLSGDWEMGRPEHVSRRLGFVLKLFGLAATVGAAVFLIAAPVLFRVAFHAKFGAGEMILPWTLMYCVWTSLASIGFNYLWCAERSRLVTGTLALGLALNVALNVVLLPVWGLWGAVISTTIAKGMVLVLIALASRWHGMRIDRGLVLVAALPLLLAVNPWAALAAATLVALARGPRLRCWTPRELAHVQSQWQNYRARAMALLARC